MDDPARPRPELFTHTYAGALLAIEGLDGMGKTTLIERLEARLRPRGVPVSIGKQPTEAARNLAMFRRYMYGPDERPHIDYRAVLATLLADRLQQLFEHVRPALAAGSCVIMDRYVYSMVAIMRARGYDEDWVLAAASYFPKPDVAVLVDAAFDVATSRVSGRADPRTSYREDDLFQRLHEEYRVFAAQGLLMKLRSDRSGPDALADVVLGELSAVRPGLMGRGSSDSEDSPVVGRQPESTTEIL